MQRQMLMRESAEQIPHLTHTVMFVSSARQRWRQILTCQWGKEDGDQAQKDIGRAHLGCSRFLVDVKSLQSRITKLEVSLCCR